MCFLSNQNLRDSTRPNFRKKCVIPYLHRKEWKRERYGDFLKREKSGKKTLEKAVVSSAVRRIGILTGLLFLCGSIAAWVLAVSPKTIEHTQTRYTYSVETNAEYRVHLRPNALYLSEWLPEGQIYSQRLSDFIEMTLYTDVEGSESAKLYGTYELSAVLQGYENQDGTIRNIYDKRYPLQSGEIPQTTGTQAAQTFKISLAMDSYWQTIQQAAQILGTAPTVQLYLLWQGEWTIDTQYGQKQQAFTYRLPIRLQQDTLLYEIEKPETQQITGELTETVTEPSVADTGTQIFYAIFGIIGIALMALFVFRTRIPTLQEENTQKLLLFVWKYRRYIVQLQHLPDFSKYEVLQMTCFSQLLQLARMIHRPIFCSVCPDGMPEKGIFYVSDTDRIYLLQMHTVATILETKEMICTAEK